MSTTSATDPTSTSSSSAQPLFSLGLIADIQYADMADSHVEGRTQRFRECPAKLKAALAAIKSEGDKLTAVLTLGDVINGNREDASLTPSDLELVASLLDAAFPPGGGEIGETPIYHVLGNHCLDLPKRRVTERLGFPQSALLLEEKPDDAGDGDEDDADECDEKREDESPAPPACYSTLIHPGWRLVALDTTEMSGHAQDSKDSAIAAEAREYSEKHPLTEGEDSENPQLSPWNGGPGSKQVEWLREELRKAAENKERVVVAGHHQIGPGKCVRRSHAAWNWREVSEVVSGGRLKDGEETTDVSSSKSSAVLYLAGHDHTGGYSSAGGVHFLTLEAIVEAPPGSNAFAVLDFYEEKIVVRGFGSATSRVLDLVSMI